MMEACFGLIRRAWPRSCLLAVLTWWMFRSGGDNSDKRLRGGYEPVPTRDIHFNQMDFQETW